ncbi:MAG: 3-oxoacyl-ACP reductase FabG [Gammaproteobacteria bacterium]|nr:3-oxoacyl-ACP reductase FabG [Gammaproteobacteria bacterium]
MSERRVSLVTGASRGIGRAIASRLAADGLFVVGTATGEEGVERIRSLLGENGAGVVLRLESADSVAAALRNAEQEFGSPSVLVNNAGITRDGLLVRMSEEAWHEVIDVDLGGLYRLTKPLLRSMMRARWGRIVNIGSVVGRMGNAGQTNYAAAKAGIEGFTRSLAREVGTRGITVNAVAPGFIDTDMTAELSDSQRAEMMRRIPLGRMGDAEEVAAAVSFLVSDEAGYITGETVHVNGGLQMH